MVWSSTRSSSVRLPGRAAALSETQLRAAPQTGSGLPLRTCASAGRAPPRAKRSVQPSQPSPLPDPRTAGVWFSTGQLRDPPGLCGSRATAKHGSTGEADARPAGRAPPGPAGDCGQPGALSPPLPIPLPGHSQARRAARRARSLRSHSISTSPPPLPPGACALPCPSMLFCPHPTWRSGPVPPTEARGSRVALPAETRLASRASTGPAHASGPMGSWPPPCRGARACCAWPPRAASGGTLAEAEGERGERERVSQNPGVLPYGRARSAGHRVRDVGPCGVSP